MELEADIASKAILFHQLVQKSYLLIVFENIPIYETKHIKPVCFIRLFKELDQVTEYAADFYGTHTTIDHS